ncbi:family 10 glycosylhydrolase [Akkermansiaceae bacterium]|nr:family 10 glycosylhydrolase [Akkermansiaceae bacterium]
MMILRFLFFLLILCSVSSAAYRNSNEKVPAFPREFRAAWVACVYNIDWPSKPGLSASTQKQQLIQLLDKAASLKLNAIIFQVRPNADAVYYSSIEPYSSWISGTMGKSSGYDPLKFCIEQAHARGIEVHAWFNPFRALPNKSMYAAPNHVSKKYPSMCKDYLNYTWMFPSRSDAQSHSLRVIADVVRRYNVDGVHIDDYFYPYPKLGAGGVELSRFPDGLSNAKRRGHINDFVKNMYSMVKGIKPHVRVGISPFGIWKPGVPSGIEATLNAYEHIAADSRKWLQNGWCDYMSPQLYWRIKPAKQSFTSLLQWWRSQGSRPVWPGIATSRINSSEDPGRPASEILNQVAYSRSIGKNWVGHIHWSMESLMKNKGGISSSLASTTYLSPALVPPMPWISKTAPAKPVIAAGSSGNQTLIKWSPVATATKYAIQARVGNKWYAVQVVPAGRTETRISGTPNAIAVTAVNALGNSSPAATVSQ